MIDLIGAGLVILAGGLFARAKTAALHAHTQLLSALLTALQIIRSEINVNLAPLSEIIDHLAQSGAPCGRDLFSDMKLLLDARGAPYFYECWQLAIDAHCYCLSDHERAALYDLGHVLGRYGVTEECAAIDRCTAELSAGYRDAKVRCAADTKLYTGLSLAAGCILAIVLL